MGMADAYFMPLCFLSEGAPEVEEGVPWETSFENRSLLPKEELCPTYWSSSQLPTFPGAFLKSALFLVAALSRCSLDLSRGEAGGVSAPFPLPPLGRLLTACQATSGTSCLTTFCVVRLRRKSKLL